jgi:hypothetical protein
MSMPSRPGAFASLVQGSLSSSTSQLTGDRAWVFLLCSFSTSRKGPWLKYNVIPVLRSLESCDQKL